MITAADAEPIATEDGAVWMPIDLTPDPDLYPAEAYRLPRVEGDGKELQNFRLSPAPKSRRRGPRCERCEEPLPVRARRGTRFCSTRCRVAAHRAGVPHELRARDRWVTHVAKRPLTPRGRPASSTDPRTWSPYEALDGMDRKGFVLNGDGIVCLDLDHCLVDGVLTERAAEILARCPSTYVEVSLLGTGLHVWGRGEVPKGRRLDGVEVYGTGRYIAVTGARYGRCSSTLADLAEVVAWLMGA